jgi:hypothetical protein
LHYVISYVWEADIVYWADSSELGRIAVRTEMKKGTEFFTFSIGKKKHTNVIIRLFFFPSQYFYFSLKGRPDAKPEARASKTNSIGEYFDRYI